MKKMILRLAVPAIAALAISALPGASIAGTSFLSSAGVQDGGIGNTSNYLKETPNISLDQKVNDIIYPLFSTPEIKKKGESLTIKVDTQGKQAGGWSVKLKQNDHSPQAVEYNLPVEKTAAGTSHWKESSTIYDVTVTVPDSVPEKLYDLEITYTGNGQRITDDEPNSVKVVNEYKKDFTFIHLTDTHVGSPRNLGDPESPTADPGLVKEAGIWNPDHEKRWLYLQKAIKEVNLSNPDFVVLTGDLMFGQMNPLEYIYEYEETYKMLLKLNVPVYIVPGNHDYYAQDATLTDGAKYWEKYFGPQYFSFNYGPYAHFIGYNSFDWHKYDRSGHGSVSVPTWGGQIREQQLNWIKSDLAENAKTAQAGQLKGLFSHHNPLWQDRDIWPSTDSDVKKYWEQYDSQHDPQRLDTLLLGEKLGLKYDQQWHGENANELKAVMKQYGVGLSLHGHTHIDNVTKEDGILYTTTTAVELTGKPWVGFRQFQMRNGQIESYNYEDPQHSIPVYENGETSKGVMSFEATYASENDGTSTSQEVTVTNRLKKPITVTIPIYLKEGSYKASEGAVRQNYSADGKQYMEVLITVPANSSKKIGIR